VRIRGGEKEDVTEHHEWCGANHDGNTRAEAGAEVWDQNCEYGAGEVGRDGVELLLDDGRLWVDGRYYCWEKECKSSDLEIM
jgi:hypothetical protein